MLWIEQLHVRLTEKVYLTIKVYPSQYIAKDIVGTWVNITAVDALVLQGTCWLNQYKMPSYQYRKSDCGDKTILRPSYLHNGISYTGKMTSLYWIRTQGIRSHTSDQAPLRKDANQLPVSHCAGMIENAIPDTYLLKSLRQSNTYIHWKYNHHWFR